MSTTTQSDLPPVGFTIEYDEYPKKSGPFTLITSIEARDKSQPGTPDHIRQNLQIQRYYEVIFSGSMLTEHDGNKKAQIESDLISFPILHYKIKEGGTVLIAIPNNLARHIMQCQGEQYTFGLADFHNGKFYTKVPAGFEDVVKKGDSQEDWLIGYVLRFGVIVPLNPDVPNSFEIIEIIPPYYDTPTPPAPPPARLPDPSRSSNIEFIQRKGSEVLAGLKNGWKQTRQRSNTRVWTSKDDVTKSRQ
jgi:hypothetical protein